MKVVVIGATGAVGREMVRDLETSSVRVSQLSLLASSRSAGETFRFRGQSYEVKAFSLSACQGFDFALMSVSQAFSKEFSPELVKLGITVIDNSAAWRMNPDCPLLVPEVNWQAYTEASHKKLIANPNCSTIQMVVALQPLKKRFGLESVHVATYQSVSGTGHKGMNELKEQTAAYLAGKESQPSVYPQPISFNLIAGIGNFDSVGHCVEEEKMILEAQKIFRMPDLPILATTVRVPVLNCHSEAIAVKLSKEYTIEEIQQTYVDAPGIVLCPEHDYAQLPHPRAVAGKQEVFVSRLRLPYGKTKSNWVQMWVVADNLKKGAATNAVQILEKMIQTS